MLKKLQKQFAKVTAARAANAQGFSLIEMLIVIALMALVGAFVGTNVMRKYDQSRVDATKIQIRQLGVILDDFRRVCGFYPMEADGLEALVKPPAARECKNYDPEGFIKDKKVPKDAWGNDFVYVGDGSKYTLTSRGADNAEGGDGFNKDISSDALE